MTIFRILFLIILVGCSTKARKWDYQYKESSTKENELSNYLSKLDTQKKKDYYNFEYLDDVELRLVSNELQEGSIGECRKKIIFVDKNTDSSMFRKLIQFCANKQYNKIYYHQYTEEEL
jgi:hypothetical protein